jgi:asparagine N-glycosylation enzyme membrane subunit Stt3
MKRISLFLVMAGVFCLSLVLGSADVFAQTTNTVDFVPIVDFGSIFGTITTALGPIVAGAIGLGLAIWGARYIFSVIKSTGR